jgi:hypothetical protein
LQKQFRPLKSLVKRMEGLMIAAGFAVFANRLTNSSITLRPFASAFLTSSRSSRVFDTDIVYAGDARSYFHRSRALSDSVS